jgi:hypothetical protein
MTSSYENILVKLVDISFINRGKKYEVGLNEEPDFDPDPQNDYSSGIHYCKAKDIGDWLFLGYTHICDVTLPTDAKTVDFYNLSRANKVILSEPIPIEDHFMWSDPGFCLTSVQNDGYMLFYISKQTPQICLAAVQRDGLALEYVQEQTPEICRAAYENDILSRRFAKY